MQRRIHHDIRAHSNVPLLNKPDSVLNLLDHLELHHYAGQPAEKQCRRVQFGYIVKAGLGVIHDPHVIQDTR
eukprot:XP_001708622.1 Hypothetical protein GL50803_32308 [Giardia lamblia ATCC 50803]